MKMLNKIIFSVACGIFFTGCSQDSGFNVASNDVKPKTTSKFVLQKNVQHLDLNQINSNKKVKKVYADAFADQPISNSSNLSTEDIKKAQEAQSVLWIKNAMIMDNIKVLFDAKKQTINVTGNVVLANEPESKLNFKFPICLEGPLLKSGISVLESSKNSSENKSCNGDSSYLVMGRWNCLDDQLNQNSVCNNYFIEFFVKKNHFIFSNQWSKTEKIISEPTKKNNDEPDEGDEFEESNGRGEYVGGFMPIPASPSQSPLPTPLPSVKKGESTSADGSIDYVDLGDATSDEEQEKPDVSSGDKNSKRVNDTHLEKNNPGKNSQNNKKGEFKTNDEKAQNQQVQDHKITDSKKSSEAQNENNSKVSNEVTGKEVPNSKSEKNSPDGKNGDSNSVQEVPKPVPAPVPSPEPTPTPKKVEKDEERKPTPKTPILKQPLDSNKNSNDNSNDNSSSNSKSNHNSNPSPNPKPNPNPISNPIETHKNVANTEKEIPHPVLPPSIEAFKNQSIGATNNGKLENASSLKMKLMYFQNQDMSAPYRLMRASRDRFYGNEEMLQFIINLGTQLMNLNINRILEIGDVAAQYGGQISGHKSHRTGLDADIGYLLKSVRSGAYGQTLLTKSGGVTNDFMKEEQWELFKKIFKIESKKIQVIFVHKQIKKTFCHLAYQNGDFNGERNPNNNPIAVEVLRKLYIQVGHNDHFHVRLNCPTKDSKCFQKEINLSKTGC